MNTKRILRESEMKMVNRSKKNIDKNTIVNLILEYGTLARMDIHELTGIRLASITELTKELIDEGYLVEGKNDLDNKKKALSINIKSATTIGIDIQPDKILALLVEPDGTIIKREQTPINASDASEVILERFLRTLDEIIESSEEIKPIGIGVSITGFLDKEKKIVLASSQMQNFSNVPLEKIVRGRYGLPVIIDDSAPLNLICERRFAKGEKPGDIIYVEVGYGVGTGILSNGSLIKGYSGLAGELGHTVVDPHGKLCVCGNRGCLRTIATSAEIVQNVSEIIKSGTYSIIFDMVGGDVNKIDIYTVLEAAKQNDKVALNVIDETAMYIGIALSNAVNMLNPRELIFGGQMFSKSDYMLEPIKRIISKNILPMFANDVIYKVGSYIGDGGALGACTVVLEKHFKELFLK